MTLDYRDSHTLETADAIDDFFHASYASDKAAVAFV